MLKPINESAIRNESEWKEFIKEIDKPRLKAKHEEEARFQTLFDIRETHFLNSNKTFKHSWIQAVENNTVAEELTGGIYDEDLFEYFDTEEKSIDEILSETSEGKLIAEKIRRQKERRGKMAAMGVLRQEREQARVQAQGMRMTSQQTEKGSSIFDIADETSYGDFKVRPLKHRRLTGRMQAIESRPKGFNRADYGLGEVSETCPYEYYSNKRDDYSSIEPYMNLRRDHFLINSSPFGRNNQLRGFRETILLAIYRVVMEYVRE